MTVLFLLWGLGIVLSFSFAADDKKKNLPSKPEKPVYMKPVDAPPLPPRFPDPSVAEVQKQIQEILKIHRSLELQREKELAEIQKIMEQARIHQQLLKDLNNPAAGKTHQPGVDEVIRKQKIQIIEEEALKNQNKIKELKKSSQRKK